MTVNKSLIWVLACFCTIALINSNALAQGIDADQQLNTDHHFGQGSQDNGWAIGEGDPWPIGLDPNGPVWHKNLHGPTFQNPTAGLNPGDYDVTESLFITGHLPWEDWHEVILTPGWEWVGGSISGSFGTIGGFLDPTSTTIWFDFPSTPPGQVVDITKKIRWLGPGQWVASQHGPIEVIEYPTPEPTSLALLGIGTLLITRRRTNR